jgi:hypothetical protein
MSDTPTPSKCECCGRFAAFRIRYPDESKPDIFLCDNCRISHERAMACGEAWAKCQQSIRMIGSITGRSEQSSTECHKTFIDGVPFLEHDKL